MKQAETLCGLTLPRSGETALLVPTQRSGTTRIGRSGRPIGPLHVNPSAWALAGEGSTTGSPNRSWGRVRSLGATSARRLLSGERLLPRQRGGGGSGLWSLVLLGINCLRAVDCVLEERNFSTTELTASPNSPDCEMGASSRNTSSFELISVRFSHKWRSVATEPAKGRPTARAGVLSGSES